MTSIEAFKILFWGVVIGLVPQLTRVFGESEWLIVVSVSQGIVMTVIGFVALRIGSVKSGKVAAAAVISLFTLAWNVILSI